MLSLIRLFLYVFKSFSSFSVWLREVRWAFSTHWASDGTGGACLVVKASLSFERTVVYLAKLSVCFKASRASL